MSNDDWPDDSRDQGFPEPNDSFGQPDEPAETQDGWYDQPVHGPPPKKRGMSTTAKILIGFFCLSGFLFLLCCGGLIYIFTQFKIETDQDPILAEQRVKEIADIEIPEGFEPEVSGTADFFFISATFAAYEHEEADGALILGEVNLEIEAGPEAEEEIRRAIRQEANERRLKIKSIETREFEIRGETAEFTFAEAENEDGEAYRQVAGGFLTEDGTGLLILQLDEEHYDEDAVVKMIESIR